jgi:hypothetical protein
LNKKNGFEGFGDVFGPFLAELQALQPDRNLEKLPSAVLFRLQEVFSKLKAFLIQAFY